ncbi:hypothetical protein X762_30775 [Mesorhizobium sp. LSHC426A00]|nr:hypothetical protein X762_30775 [Mesorhizobium sp. LSHC426A00]
MGCGICACLGHLRVGDGRVFAGGVLTPLAHDLGVTDGAAGQALTATAIAGAISAPTMAVITERRVGDDAAADPVQRSIRSRVVATVFLTAPVALGIALRGFWSISAALATCRQPM